MGTEITKSIPNQVTHRVRRYCILVIPGRALLRTEPISMRSLIETLHLYRYRIATFNFILILCIRVQVELDILGTSRRQLIIRRIDLFYFYAIYPLDKLVVVTCIGRIGIDDISQLIGAAEDLFFGYIKVIETDLHRQRRNGAYGI